MFEYEMFMDRASCMNNDPVKIAHYLIQNFGIFLLYAVGYTSLFIRIMRRRDEFKRLRLHLGLWAAFFIFCGGGHFIDAIMTWMPVYNFQIFWTYGTLFSTAIAFFYSLPLILKSTGE